MTRHTLQDLLDLMSCLRDPTHGCPWDRAQRAVDIVPFTLEEAYEVADAIEAGRFDDLSSELGDLLFQVVFYAQLASEQGQFEFADVVHAIVQKLLVRHPHVFPQATLASFGQPSNTGLSEINVRWEDTKALERRERGQLGLFDDVPLALPALSRAQKIQKRASRVGFDWRGYEPILAVMQTELGELCDVITACDAAGIEDELGDVLFTAVNLARHLSVDAEQALRRSTRKFELRMTHVMTEAAATGHRLDEMSDDEKEGLWTGAKQAHLNE